jgi:hypothetical protein
MKIKGNILISRRDFVKEAYGDKGWEDVLRVLPEADRETLRGMISNLGWYPFEVGKLLDEAIVRVVGKGDLKIFEQIGAASAQQNLSTVHKLSIAAGDPQAFMAKTPVIYKLYYDLGRREYEATGPNSGVVTTYDAETFSTADCMTVIGWFKHALAMCGAKKVVMTEDSCRASGAEFCRYKVHWD